MRAELPDRSSDKLSRISLVNYFGNDGPLSFLELENETNKLVRRVVDDPLPLQRLNASAMACRVSKVRCTSRDLRPGSGTTASASKTVSHGWSIRIQRGSDPCTRPADEGNEPLFQGPHASDFGDKLERTQYAALAVPAGMIWQAKSASSVSRFLHHAD